MKRLLLALTLVLFTSISFAQSPEAIKYQAVARDANGDVYANTNVSMRISVLETSTTGPAVYVETHSATSNDYGLINLEIGTGTPVTGTFAAIDWGSDLHYVKVEIDPAGGNNYEVMGTSQMLSVPYALYAESAGNTDDADSDPTNELITNAQLNGAGLEIEEAGNVQTVDLSSLINDNDANPGNELINNVSYQNDTITITEAGIDHIIDLTGLQDNDSDSTNEIQDLQLAGNILTITDNSSATAIDLSPYLDNTDQQSLSISNTGTVFTVTIANGNSISFDVADNDNDPTNEIQSLSKTGNQISLSNGGGTVTDDVDDADNDPANESLTNATLNSTDLEITESGNLTTVDLSPLVDDADADPNNEIQTISKTGNQISLSNGGGTVTDDVDDADADPSNEFQTISKSGNTVTLSDGGGSFTDDVDDADADPANETLTNAALNGNDLELTESGNLTIVDLSSLVDDADADPANETLTNATLNGNDLELTESGNLFTVNLSSLVDDADADPTNEFQTVSKSGNIVTLSDGGGSFTDDVDDADADPANETLTNAALNGNDLELTESGSLTTVDLSSLVDDADADPANESLTNAALNGNDLELTESGSLTTVDLSSLVDDADADPSNESVTNFVLNGNTLELTESGNLNTVDLSSLSDADADSTNEIQDLSLVNDTLTITNNASATDISLLNYKPVWEVNGSDDKYTFDRVGINTSSPGYSIDISDTLDGTKSNSINVVASSTTGGSRQIGVRSFITGTGNVYYNAVEGVSNGQSTGFNVGGFYRAYDGRANRAVIARAGIDNTIGGTNNSSNYGVFATATNSATFNCSVFGSTGSSSPFNAGVYGYIFDNQGVGPGYALYGYNQSSGSSDNYGAFLTVDNSSGTNYGVYAETPGSAGTSFAGYFDGDVEITGDLNVTGNISKGGGTFKIDHPEDPTNKYLVHSFVESPEMMNVYNGNIETDANGYATVELPEYFESANKDFRYQLTVIGSFAQAIVKEKISDNKFIIQTDQPNVEVSWQVTGIRNDPYAQKNRIKPVQEKPAQHKGTYLHPAVYDADESSSQHEKYGPDKEKQRKAQKQIEKDLSDK